ncbi:NAD-dependent epimerase/dehydratase family protein [Pilimelia columellifera]|uniref:NAD-dependent epimerase/dehydratase family protein n=1 Tax=Pilimelia columellifera subsp. columellifera TaxID=706583 RepID=A0ABN3NFI2_9ACTN
MTAAPTPGSPGVVVVTGVSRFLAATVAGRLAADPSVGRVIGLDSVAVPDAVAPLLRGVERISADERDAASAIADLGATAVAHLAITAAPDRTDDDGVHKERNIIGTMRLLAACQQAPGLRKLVVRSSTAAYGASFRDPAVFTEETEPRAVPRGGFARDILDIEGYVRGFCRRRPDVVGTVLRFAPVIGSAANTTLTRYFSSPLVPTVFGRDPRLQFVHLDDAIEVLVRAVTGDHPGTFNVAGPGVLTLSQAIRRAGRIGVPVWEGGLSAAAALARGLDLRGFSFDQLDLFVHGRVVDTDRLIAEFGFQPRSTAEAFDDFISAHRGGTVIPAAQVAAAEQAILDGIRQARRARSGHV